MKDGNFEWPRILWVVPVVDHLIDWARHHTGIGSAGARHVAASIVHFGPTDSED